MSARSTLITLALLGIGAYYLMNKPSDTTQVPDEYKLPSHITGVDEEGIPIIAIKNHHMAIGGGAKFRGMDVDRFGL